MGESKCAVAFQGEGYSRTSHIRTGHAEIISRYWVTLTRDTIQTRKKQYSFCFIIKALGRSAMQGVHRRTV